MIESRGVIERLETSSLFVAFVEARIGLISASAAAKVYVAAAVSNGAK
jgi:hypothetical protein